MPRELKPGEKAPASGQYEIIGPRGGATGNERTVTKGEPLPPTPKSGETYVLVDKTKHKTGYKTKSPACYGWATTWWGLNPPPRVFQTPALPQLSCSPSADGGTRTRTLLTVACRNHFMIAARLLCLPISPQQHHYSNAQTKGPKKKDGSAYAHLL